MNILTIPVTAFSRKLILSQHGQAEPVKLKASDTLAGQLCCVKPGDTAKFDKPKATLTSHIDVLLNDNLAKHINAKRLWRVGLHLDNCHRSELNKYVESKVEEGIGATTAIYQFCEDHDIDVDVDINFETLYKDWQRHISAKNKNNSAFFRRQKQTFVRRVGEKSAKKRASNKLFTDIELDAMAAFYVSQNFELFQTTRGLQRTKLQQQLELYVYRVIGNRTPQYVCKKFGLTKAYLIARKETPQYKPRTDYTNQVRYAVRAFKIFLKTAPSIVLPEPVL